MPRRRPPSPAAAPDRAAAPARTSAAAAPAPAAEPAGGGAAAGDDAPARARTGWAALAAALLVAFVHLAPAAPLGPGGLSADIGIQYFLGGETARGAVPLVDFSHTWNVASWWFNALVYRLAGGDPSTWLYLWARVCGPALAGLTAVGVLWRLRLRWEWVLIGAGAWLALSHVLHAKYAIPVLWVFVLVPTARPRGLRADVLARALLAGLTVLSQVELAVLLGAGVVLWDLVGPSRPLDRDQLRRRRLRAAAIPAGIAVALALELAGYAAIGQPPGEILRQLIGNAAETAEGFTYGYPLASAPSVRPKLFPASLLVAFVPAVWVRLGGAARLVACLHLAQALIAIRRPDPAHVDAATTLLGLLAVLVAHDLLADPRGRGPIGPAVRARSWALGPDLARAAAGAAVVAVAVAVAFGVASPAAVAVPTALAGLAALWADRQGGGGASLPASAGALAAITTLLLVTTAGGIATALRGDRALDPVRELAAAVAAPLDRCTGGERTAWVVPEPLPLYTELGVTNPTPYAVFWYGFAAEHDRVRALLDDRAIPAIVQVGSWPASFGDLPDDIAAAMTPCAELDATATTPPVTIWTPRG